MAYFTFLAIFLGIPLAALGILTFLDLHRGRRLPADLSHGSPWVFLLILVMLAVVYTTPWDNYLVATGVWFYNPGLVTGLRLGWVPIEEYTFFVIQTLVTGLWLLFLARRSSAQPNQKDGGQFRRPPLPPVLILAGLWIFSAALLASGWQPGTYLALILVWAIPPILLQAAYGWDLLWSRRRLVLSALFSTTVYLAAADSLAIGSGTWTIAPEQSLNLRLGGILPIEELLFFLVTNTLIVLGMVLMLSPQNQERIQGIRQIIRQLSPSRKIQVLQDER
jgi:lycopene cyclase domain-containing protein